MTEPLGTATHPLRVAIIGSGPSGFYAAEHLQKQSNLVVEIDMFDRLPTPFGLVRGGVAPDHPKIKSVTKVYERIASKPGFRFFGNVEFGKHITLEDLQQYYHAVIFAVGAQSDRQLDIPGEDLLGSHAATEFVAWYNAHPDYRDAKFDLSVQNVAVIGLGNVAMDVTRILAQTADELYETDIADYALEELKQSNVRNIYVLGRRGPAQSAFTNPEIKELGELDDAEVIVDPKEMKLDPSSQAYIDAGGDKVAVKNVEILNGYAEKGDSGKPRKIIMRFLVSPVELIGTDKVEAIKLVKNELYVNEKGDLRPRATDEYETIPVGLVFRSVGYHGVPLEGVPFYEKWGIIPNDEGRVTSSFKDGSVVTGEYVVGWIKRGPSGIIGTNKPDSVETVNHMLEDVQADKVWTPVQPDATAVLNLIRERQPEFVTFADWQVLDEAELERGKSLGRSRVKFSRVEDMLGVLAKTHDKHLPQVGD
ncbi:MAG: FAD-dependent oxidoreductase [Anaerolineae bacterium]|nr:FAD-dependent oxidoreductase [Anaerolineae bacterium]